MVQVLATDGDTGLNGVVEFELVTAGSSDHQYFSIDKKSGVMTVAQDIDREKQVYYNVSGQLNYSMFTWVTSVQVFIGCLLDTAVCVRWLQLPTSFSKVVNLKLLQSISAPLQRQIHHKMRKTRLKIPAASSVFCPSLHKSKNKFGRSFAFDTPTIKKKCLMGFLLLPLSSP